MDLSMVLFHISLSFTYFLSSKKYGKKDGKYEGKVPATIIPYDNIFFIDKKVVVSDGRGYFFYRLLDVDETKR